MSAPRTPSIAEADHTVEGEAEEIIPQLAADLERGEAKPHYFKKQWPDVTQVPLPDLHRARCAAIVPCRFNTRAAALYL